MPSLPNKGTSNTGLGTVEVDEWSERVYRALSSWSIANQGKWSRWEPGYFLLIIDHVDGKAVDPIQLYTTDREVTVEFGYWIDHGFNDASSESSPEFFAEQAKILIQKWLGQELKTAVFTDIDGKWCGTTIIEHGDLNSQLEAGANHLRDNKPHKIELRSVHKGDWEIIDINEDWLLPPKLSPNRLP